ncbi:MAG: transcription elongation factor GreA [Anaerolineales bacterium]|nr:transcription elongation factor GreA [Anaerolineales bacterium]
MAEQPVYVTRDGFQKLEEELDHLRKVRRAEVATRLREAMEGGELIDNAEYEAAKNEQAFVEGKILELDRMLARAQVIEAVSSRDKVLIGSTVVIREKHKRNTETYTIVGAAEADPKQGLISNESPLGKALLDQKPGDTVEIKAPAGNLEFHIVEIK